MKISAKKYAEALLVSLEGKGEKEVSRQIGVLLDLMKANGDKKKTTMLVKYFSELWDAKNNISVVDVTTALPMDKSTQKHVREYVKDKFQTEKVEINMSVDAKVLGGVLIRKNDKVYDGSLKTRLSDFQKSILK